MATNLPSLDIELLSVRRIIPFQYGYTIYNPNTLFVTDNNGQLQGIGLDEYFSTFGILEPSSIAPYLQVALISSTYGLTYSNISTISYETNSSIINALWPSTNVYLYSTILSTTISTILRVDGDVSTLSSYVRYNNTALGTSSLSTSLASLSNLTMRGLSTLSTTIGQTTISTLCTINLSFSNIVNNNNAGVGLSSLSTSMSLNFSSFSTILSLNPTSIEGLCSLSTVVYTYISSFSAGEGVSSLSTLNARQFVTLNSSRGLSSLSTVVSQSISSFSTSIGRFAAGARSLSTFSSGVALSFYNYDSGPGVSSLSTNIVNFISSFSTSIGKNPPGIDGVCSLVIDVSLGLSSVVSSEGLSSLSTSLSYGLSSVASSEGISSLSTSLSFGLSSVAASRGLSSLSTSLSMGLSSVAASRGLSSLSTSLSYGLSTIASGPGISSLSSAMTASLLLAGSGEGVSSVSTYMGQISTVDLQFSGFFDFINSVQPLHRFTDKPALGLNCYPDGLATLDVNGMTHFRSTVYLTNTQLSINNADFYNIPPRADLDVSGSIVAGNLFVNAVGTFGESVTASLFLTPSDSNLKENIIGIEDALSTIQKLRGVNFNWIAGGKKDIGCIAQELQEVIPLMVTQGESYLVVAYEKLIPFLLESIKELSKRVDILERRI